MESIGSRGRLLLLVVLLLTEVMLLLLQVLVVARRRHGERDGRARRRPSSCSAVGGSRGIVVGRDARGSGDCDGGDRCRAGVLHRLWKEGRVTVLVIGRNISVGKKPMIYSSGRGRC